jgi:hypothetical protein
MSRRHRPERSLARLLLALMIVQAAAGLAWPHLYRDTGWIEATWFGNDLVTIVVAVPLLWWADGSARRGSSRGRLVAAGVTAYAAYNYAFYVFGAALNALFLLYLAALVVSTAALILDLSSPDTQALARNVSPRLPVGVVGSGLIAIGGLLAAVWVGIWAAYVFGGRPTPVEPEAFRLIAGLDLSLMAPALISGGLLLRRREGWGGVIAAVASIQAALYLLVLSVNSVIAISRGLAESPGELPVWGTLAVTTSTLAGTLLIHARRPALSRG